MESVFPPPLSPFHPPSSPFPFPSSIFPFPLSNVQLPISKGHVLSPLSLGTVLDRTVQCQRTRGLSKGGT